MKISLIRVGSNAIIAFGENTHTIAITSEDFFESLKKRVEEFQKDFKKLSNVGTFSKLLDTVSPERVKARAEKLKQLSNAAENYLVELNPERKCKNADILCKHSKDFKKDSKDNVYYRNISEPFPKILVDELVKIVKKRKSVYTMNSLIMFWFQLSLNPDIAVKNDLFGWIGENGFSITEEGNIISYRDVYQTENTHSELDAFIMDYYVKAKRWKKKPTKCLIYEKPKGGYYFRDISKKVDKYKKFVYLGTLEELYQKSIETSEAVYTDMYTKSMKITIGKPVSMPRKECNSDPRSSCSYGLHQKSHRYSMTFGDVNLTCLVSPYHVVAIPHRDPQKFRCCQYLPIGLTQLRGGKVVPFKPGTFDIKYNGIEQLRDQLKDLIKSGEISEEQTEETAEMILDKYRETIKRMETTI